MPAAARLALHAARCASARLRSSTGISTEMPRRNTAAAVASCRQLTPSVRGGSANICTCWANRSRCRASATACMVLATRPSSRRASCPSGPRSCRGCRRSSTAATRSTRSRDPTGTGPAPGSSPRRRWSSATSNASPSASHSGVIDTGSCGVASRRAAAATLASVAATSASPWPSLVSPPPAKSAVRSRSNRFNTPRTRRARSSAASTACPASIASSTAASGSHKWATAAASSSGLRLDSGFGMTRLQRRKQEEGSDRTVKNALLSTRQDAKPLSHQPKSRKHSLGVSVPWRPGNVVDRGCCSAFLKSKSPSPQPLSPQLPIPRLPHLGERPDGRVQPALHRAQRDAQHLGDFLVRKLLKVRQ